MTDKWADVAAAYSVERAGGTLFYNTWRGGSFQEVVGFLLEEQQGLLTEAVGRTGADVSDFRQGMEAMARSLKGLTKSGKGDVFQHDIAAGVVAVFGGRESALRAAEANPNDFDKGLRSFAQVVFQHCGINAKPLERVLALEEQDQKPPTITAAYRIN